MRASGLADGVTSLEDFAELPLVTKEELVSDQLAHPPYGSNLTYPLERYVRLHQTSGTSGGTPLRWLDTARSWRTLLATWQKVLAACSVTPRDRVFFPFSFGPFLGFWTAFDAAADLGCLVIPGGGLSSRGRLDVLLENAATVICCTPTYALRLGEMAATEGLDLAADARDRRLIVAGEPGGSVPAVRQRIGELWHGAAVFDHHGMTEVGPVSYPESAADGSALRVDGRAFHAEVIEPTSGEAVAEGEIGELVLTTLERHGSPLLRYRTGDLVRRGPSVGGDLRLEGGILARRDDMVVVRGVNLYPSAVEQVIRQEAGVAEYRVRLDQRRAMTEVSLEIEPMDDAPAAAADRLAQRVAERLRAAFNLRFPVTTVAPGTLPRFELKARRWVHG